MRRRWPHCQGLLCPEGESGKWRASNSERKSERAEQQRQRQRKARVVSVDAAVDAHVPVKTAVAGELPAARTKRRKRQW